MRSLNANSGILGRLLKVIYFLISIPVWGVALGILIEESRTASDKLDYYRISLVFIIGIISYVIITDLVTRTNAYIVRGSFKGFLTYGLILKHYWYIVLLTIALCIGLAARSNYIKTQCTLVNQNIDKQGVCSCTNGYFMAINSDCTTQLGRKIVELLPPKSLLREIKIIESNQTFLGIYIKDFSIDEPNINDEGMPYISCPEEVQGQGIKGEYHIFTYEDGKITSDIKIPPMEDSFPLILSYLNTKNNNHFYFGGEKPQSESEKFTIERSNLINFQDYNGDGIDNEFLLVNAFDSVCGHKNYLIAGYDQNDKAIIYPIVGRGRVYYWSDNFLPNEKGEVVNGWSCGDHGAETSLTNWYTFNDKGDEYVLERSEEGECE